MPHKEDVVIPVSNGKRLLTSKAAHKGHGAMSPSQTAASDVCIANHILKGYTFVQTSEICGVGRNTVMQRLKKLRQRWHEQAAADIAQHQSQLLKKFELVAHEAWQAWERSIGTHRKTKIKAERVTIRGQGATHDAMQPVEQTFADEELAGDPRFLDVAARAYAKMAQITGVLQADTSTTNVFAIAAVAQEPVYHERVRRFAEQLGYTVEQYAALAMESDAGPAQIADRVDSQEPMDSEDGRADREASLVPHL